MFRLVMGNIVICLSSLFEIKSICLVDFGVYSTLCCVSCLFYSSIIKSFKFQTSEIVAVVISVLFIQPLFF